MKMANDLRRIEPRARRRVGKGLTEHERLEFDPIALADAVARDPSLAPEVSRIVCLALPTPGERIGRIEEWAKSKLRKDGLPDRSGIVEVGQDGSWRWWDAASAARRPVRRCTAFSYAQQEEESETWLASRALELIESLKQSTAPGVELVAAIQLGAIVERQLWKGKHEAAAVEGHRNADGRRKGQPRAAAATSARARERLQAIAAEAGKLWKKHPDLRGCYSATGRQIHAMKLDSLRLSPTRFLGLARIRKAISEAYRKGLLA